MARIGEILVKEGACTADAVKDALRNQIIFGGRLGTNLLEVGSVKEDALSRALGMRHGCAAISGDVILDPAAVALLRPEIADRFEAVPYLLADRKLAVLACDPSDLAMLDEVAFATGRRVHALVAPEARIWALLRQTYGIDRHLRGIDVDFGTVRRAAAAPAAAPEDARGGDLMGEADFDSIYGKTGAFALDAPASPGPGDPGTAVRPALDAGPAHGRGALRPVPEDEVPELADELLETVLPEPAPEVLAALAHDAGHAPPQRLVLPPRREELEPSPLTFAEAVRFLEGVAEREAIGRTVLRYARSKFRRAVLLTIQRGAAQGWAGLGEKLGAAAVRKIRIPLGTPGVVDTVVRTRAHFLGPIPKTEANVRLLKQLGGGVPANALLVPILALGRVVNVFYADAGKGALLDASGVGELLILATRISQSYDSLLARVR